MKKIYIIILLVVVVALGIIITTLSDSSTYSTFKEAKKNKGKECNIIGKLDTTKALIYDPTRNTNLFTFYMKDTEGTEMKVEYKKPRPTDFEKAEQLVLTGEIQDSVFFASDILLKCPSKYQDKEKLQGKE